MKLRGAISFRSIATDHLAKAKILLDGSNRDLNLVRSGCRKIYFLNLENIGFSMSAEA
ncbi:hypothetical protein GCM10011611_21130 [Aliidongia dinghuensis]|uniref:Uncharacterized protein n=1 Tax=Aliidongia dinghuensis TaxID=1867774 RepID=A0A8J2YSH4_9PROT|nr:hypothetical protein [Aliidongia dinghuensis]GGF15131.1 hypothetical protein GCM10011611_21130 [Aliidongia dinghuensis]